jgi:peptidoglycan/xylan/chitin deacetylase (PgdA/CDA1 family)
VLVFVLLGFGLVALAHTAPFPFLLDAAARDRAVWRMPPRSGAPAIYLTFDDGPNPAATPALLDVLARERVRGTFFLIDRHLTEDTAPIVARMFAEGHGVALHSDTRALMLQSPAQMARTLESAAARIEQLTGSRPCRAFRPHAGWRSGQMFQGVTRAGYRLVGWGWNLWDWNWFRRRDPIRLAGRLNRHASNGAIIVIHDGHHKNPRADRQYAVDTVAALVPLLRSRGFELRTICQDLAPEI